MAYLDNIIIFGKNEADHIKNIETIFQNLKAAGLKVKESKCDFFKREIHYLGHLIPVDEMYANLHSARIFSTLDLQSGY